MRTKYFWHHLVELEDLIGELATLDISQKEREELADIAHINLHHAIVDRILSELSEVDKKRFLELVAHGEDGKIWEHIGAKVEKIEDKIKDAAVKLKKELREDIKKVKV